MSPVTQIDQPVDQPVIFKPESPWSAAGGPYNRIGKRVFDVTVALLGGVLILPVMLVVALLIRLDGGPVFYCQKRVGVSGREFDFWKFRSMVPNAKAELEAYLRRNPEAAREWEVSQKLRNDPRVTAVGRFIRKTSIDELPQLWNVLKGDMSLVGPRPMMPEQKALYPGRDYYLLRPGITGYWQVSERNECSFAERAWFDARYAEDVSLATDLRTMAKTVGAVVRASGC